MVLWEFAYCSEVACCIRIKIWCNLYSVRIGIWILCWIIFSL